MNIDKILVLDAMGVIYQSCDDVEELLVPFIREKGSNIDKTIIEDLYTRASLGEFSSEEFWAKVDVDYNLEDEYLDRHQLSVGLLDFLVVFKNFKLPIYCLSNDVSEWSIKLRQKFQLDQYIEKWFISGDLEVRKPSSGIYDILIREANVEPTQMLFVDDREKNIIKADEFGIQTVLCKINNSAEGYNDDDESTEIYSFNELLDHFNKL